VNQQPSISAIVGSKNPVKINAIEQTLATLFPDSKVIVEGIHAPSLVADQPLTEDETLTGARNRVEYCRQVWANKNKKADFYAAMEGGVDKFEYGAATFAYVVISNGNEETVGRSANLPIPLSVYHSLLEGEELGPLMDKLFGTTNIKQKGGAIGLLTNGAQTRLSTYVQALTLAMARFLHSERF